MAAPAVLSPNAVGWSRPTVASFQFHVATLCRWYKTCPQVRREAPEPQKKLISGPGFLCRAAAIASAGMDNSRKLSVVFMAASEKKHLCLPLCLLTRHAQSFKPPQGAPPRQPGEQLCCRCVLWWQLAVVAAPDGSCRWLCCSNCKFCSLPCELRA